MRRLERLSLMSFNRSFPFYYRYVDDICMVVTPSDIDALLQAFNSFHPRLQFTIEIGGDKLEFLDVTIFKLNSKLIFDWYRKPSLSDRFLNFNSNHPVSQKKGTIYSLVDRAFILSDYSFHTKNLIFGINILLENDYPLPFIFNTVNQRIKQLLRYHLYSIHNSTKNLNDVQPSSWLTVPFIPHHTERFKRFSNNDVRASFHSPNKMGKYRKVQKDSLSKNSKNNVVYKISCENCDATYVGQASRQLKSRISEHRNHIRHNASTRSVITEHRLQHGHEFQWDNVEIFDEEPCY
ncbi:hypothetical protein ALC57_18725 [Trachymyrmex cornetzi]|uniref:GIY-YIG domain-containing protein n=1 Tax=Trachymyrmex cornetzi TaxID=471704 RepID=A0A151IR72_9HYME|nr:hypothetical protein ALC57_18725 [Trachymyrmex cornetzi]